MPLSEGDRIDRFTIEALLGRGGMGVVYRARDPRLGRRVAIKLLEGLAADSPARARFDREARLIASLDHPAAVHVYEAGESDGTPCIVMELVDGVTLRVAAATEASWRVKLGWLVEAPAVLCGFAELQILLGSGRCAEAESEARAFIANRPRSSAGYDWLSSALMARAAPEEAVEAALEQSEQRQVHGTTGAYRGRTEFMEHEKEVYGDFTTSGTIQAPRSRGLPWRSFRPVRISRGCARCSLATRSRSTCSASGSSWREGAVRTSPSRGCATV